MLVLICVFFFLLSFSLETTYATDGIGALLFVTQQPCVTVS